LTYLIAKKNKKVDFMGMNKTFEEFSNKRGEGAAKIAENAKEKGGLSILTYYHFVVKEPYYKKAEQGTLDLVKSKKELKQLVEELYQGINDMSIKQVAFQKLVGKIEVLGELLIENKEA
jgi:DNA-binding ferritin-like protein